MPQTGIPYIDLIIIVTLIYYIYKGFQRGFVDEFLRIFGTIVALLSAVHFMSNLSKILIGANFPPLASVIISFIVIFVGIIYVFRFIRDKLKNAIKFSIGIANIDKIVGGTLGLFKGAIVVSLCTILLSVVAFNPFLKRHISQSQLFNPMRRIAPLAYSTFRLFMPNSKSFVDELEENFFSIANYNRGEQADKLIEFYKKK